MLRLGEGEEAGQVSLGRPLGVSIPARLLGSDHGLSNRVAKRLTHGDAAAAYATIQREIDALLWLQLYSRPHWATVSYFPSLFIIIMLHTSSSLRVRLDYH
jgi:hypothetical protein